LFSKKTDKMKRTQFLHTVTGGIAAACVYCLAAACSSSEAPTPASPPGQVPISNAFTVNLNSELRGINEFISKNGIILIRLATGDVPSSFLAVSSVCPHAGATVDYLSTKSSFVCLAHGSTFSSDGSLLTGPAAQGLTKLVVQIVGTTLTVK
jgi:Rieske Fe-S protein